MQDKYYGTTMNTMGHTNQSLVLSYIGNPIEGMMDEMQGRQISYQDTCI